MADPKSTKPAESTKPATPAASKAKATPAKPTTAAKPTPKAGEPAAQTKTLASESAAATAPVADENLARASASNEQPAPSAEEIQRMISEAAYYLAEKRGFEPGFEDEDWETAKAAVMEKIKASESSEDSAN